MKVLLTNDDGFGSEGITELEKAIENAGHEVWVCAPFTQKSSCSHAIILRRPIALTKVYERHYKCDGNPADCVIYFLRGGFPLGLNSEMPDVLISGINNGYNMSSDILYSGTVGAATEGAFFNIPSIAVSVLDNPVNAFKDAAKFVADNLEKFVPLIKPGCILNINVPENSNCEWDISAPAMLEYYRHTITEGPEGMYTFTGEANKGLKPEDFLIRVNGKYRTDVDIVVKQNKIAVSAVKVIPEVDCEVQDAIGKLR